jgi:hypothetical protein
VCTIRTEVSRLFAKKQVLEGAKGIFAIFAAELNK